MKVRKAMAARATRKARLERLIGKLADEPEAKLDSRSLSARK